MKHIFNWDNFKINESNITPHKVLFLQSDFPIKFYGEKDINNLFRGCHSSDDIFETLFREKSPQTTVDFANYDDVSRYQNEYYVNDNKLSEYDYVFFGFMYRFTTISTLLVNHLVKHGIPHMKYETYDYYHNKAYQFDLLETLGYPYIPSIMTTKLTHNIINQVKLFGYPVIVKDVFSDRGEAVYEIKDKEELIDTFDYNDKLMLIQKYIPNDGEYRVITIKNKVVLIAKKDAVSGVNKKNLNARKSKKGYLPQDVINMCEDVSKHMFTDIIGFDIIQDKNDGKYYIIETNASPHFSMFSVVTNVSVPEKIVDYILQEIEK